MLSSGMKGLMALVEAMACRLPSSAQIAQGPRYYSRRSDGVLVPPDDAGFNSGYESFDGKSDERHRLRMRAGEVVDRPSTERIMALWGG